MSTHAATEHSSGMTHLPDKRTSGSTEKKLRYRKFTSGHLRILVLHSRDYLLAEIVRALKLLGHDVRISMIRCGHHDDNAVTCIERIIVAIAGFQPDFVLTVNHLGFDREGILTGLFNEIGLPHASWCIDSPVFVLDDYRECISPFTAFFVWDRDYIDDIRVRGYENVFYLPLASDTYFFRKIPQTENPLLNLACGVGFVGNSGTGLVQRCISVIGGGNGVSGMIDSCARRFIKSRSRQISSEAGLFDDSEYTRYISMPARQRHAFDRAVVWRATQLYRYSCIDELMPFEPRIAGDSGWNTLIDGNAFLHSELNYYEELPFFYNACTINFNATSLQMKTGLNQRIFDVPACGGFLITDYREQIEEMFNPDTEVVCYRNTAEIGDIVSFYLKHADERNKISERARRRVTSQHTYAHRLAVLTECMRKIYG